MSVVIESVSTGGSQNSWIASGTAVTAPTGIEVGDTIVICVIAYGAIATPSGFTSRINLVNTDASQHDMAVFDKVAVTADTTAPSYAPTWASGTGCVMIVRLSNTPTDGNNFNVAFDTESGTPRTVSADNSALILCHLRSHDDDGVSTTISYEINGTNPTWTERLDAARNTGANGDVALAYATAILPVAQEINSVTVLSSREDFSSPISTIIAVYRPIVDATGTNALLSVSPTLLTQNGVAGVVGTTELLEVTQDTIFDQSGKGTTPTNWSNETKPSTSWTNDTP